MKKSTIITYSKTVMERLKGYVGDRKRRAFVTRAERPVRLNRLTEVFGKAGKEVEIPFKVTPHGLRTSTVIYLKQQGFQDSDITKVTGHSSIVMVCAYDKTSQESNAIEKIQLVT